MQNRATKPNTIDLNADLGEGTATAPVGDDAAMLAIVSSANIACGVHGGDAITMRRTIAAAKARGVAIGAHPGLDDRAHAGRRAMPGLADDPDTIAALLREQIATLTEAAREHAATITHCKLHGALYHMAARDDAVARITAATIKSIAPTLLIFCPPQSALERAGRAAGLAIMREVFADRAYDDDGNLIPRDEKNALITDPATATKRMLDFCATGSITTITGKRLALEAETICVHGDTANAVAIATALRDGLTDAGITIAAHKN